jgi:parallel beta-helix repeat protein
MDTTNTVNGKPVYYLVNQSNLLVEPSTYPEIGYLAIINSINVTVREVQPVGGNRQDVLFAFTNSSSVEDCSFSNRGYAGIQLQNCHNVTITECEIINHYHGIRVDESNFNWVKHNLIRDNFWTGIVMEGKSNQIVENNMSNYEENIALYRSTNNSIFHNNFFGGWVPLLHESYFNIWDDGYPSGGNYWSDHTGVDSYSGSYQNDTGSDGIGDTPYVIDGSNQDNYPLMQPYHGPARNLNTGQSYLAIQEAINNASEGDTILALSGIYYEHVVVNKTVSLLGESRETTIIDGSGDGVAIQVESDNVTISGFTIQNSYEGIVASKVSYLNVCNNTIRDIHRYGSPGITISPFPDYSIGNSIMHNNITGEIWFAHHVGESIISNNVIGKIYVFDVCWDNIISENIISNEIRIDGPQSGHHPLSNCTISGNVFLNGQIYIYYHAGYNTIIENTFLDSWRGWGIGLDQGANNNLIYHNNFFNRSNNVYIYESTNNFWDDGYPSGGNYWSNYVGVDVKSGPNQDLPGSDGLGDTPYIIDASNTDHYPLFVGAPPPPTYSLTITTTVGGTTDPAPGTYGYTANSTVQVTAIPAANYLFDYWELDSANVGSANPYSVLMDKNHALKAVFALIPPPLSASISPLSASILAGQSVTFTSTVSGGYTPYSYQWYLNGNPVSGANSASWTFTPTTSGIYYVHLKVTDAKANTAQSDAARIAVATVPVGGYSFSIQVQTRAEPTIPYIALVATLTAIFTKLRPKTKRKR